MKNFSHLPKILTIATSPFPANLLVLILLRLFFVLYNDLRDLCNPTPARGGGEGSATFLVSAPPPDRKGIRTSFGPSHFSDLPLSPPCCLGGKCEDGCKIRYIPSFLLEPCPFYNSVAVSISQKQQSEISSSLVSEYSKQFLYSGYPYIRF